MLGLSEAQKNAGFSQFRRDQGSQNKQKANTTALMSQEK
jgi:hypothetical protein